jgi:hypothetical protein
MVERIRPKSYQSLVVATPKRGAPKKYDARTFPRTAKFLAQRGAIQAEIADCFGVKTRTLEKWLVQYPELREAVDVGNDVFNSRVERALAERAIGFYVDVEEVKVLGDGEVVRYNVRKYFPPDVTAGIFFLKNRLPDQWRDVQRHEVNATGLKSSEELRQLLAAEFQDLIDQGLLMLPDRDRKMKEINPRGNRGRGDGD